jgi:solute carrier family 25 carnitine/acylcarnitine transporter 20/29
VFLQVMGAGVMAGFGLWGSMFPIDTIKSKIQADSLSKPQFKGALNCLERSMEVEVRGGKQLLSILRLMLCFDT